MPGKPMLWSVAKPLTATYVVCACALAVAQNSWLTLVGDPADSQADTVQVDVQSRLANTTQPTLNVRVSRSSLRSGWDNVPYRSYTSTLVVDCVEKTARYLDATFYMMPLWQGKPHTTSNFSPLETRPMAFPDVAPNPAASIIKAACITTAR